MNKTLKLAGAAVVAMSTASAALAQEAAPTAAPAEILVTAQKRSERLHEVPVAVSVVTGAKLDAQGKASLEGVVNLVPSFNFLKSGTTLNQSLFLRGVGTATFSIAGEPSVSTVVDGVVYSRSGEAFSELVDVDRIEVLRGPQGTLFGKNASAGVINIISKRPTSTLGGYLEAGYYSASEYRLRGALNVPLADNVRTRVNGFYTDYAGNITNVGVAGDPKVNGYRHYGGRFQLDADVAPDVKVALALDYHHNNDDCCAEIIGTPPLTAAGVPTTNPTSSALPTPMGDQTRAVAQNLITSTIETGFGFSGEVDAKVSGLTLTSITAYRTWKNTEIRDGDFLPGPYIGFNQLHDFGPETSDTFTQELRLTSPGHRLIDYVIGGYYSHAYSERVFIRNDVVCAAATPPPAGDLDLMLEPARGAVDFPSGRADFGSTFRNLSAFGQATVNLNQRFRLIGGMRFTSDHLDVFHSRVTTLAGPGINPNFDQGVYDAFFAGAANPVAFSNGVHWQGHATSTNLSGKVGAQVDATHNTMAYATYSRGYKGPAFNVFFNLTATGTNVIAPETSDAFEAGLKNTFLDGTLVLNLAGYYAKYHNFQANNPDIVAGVVVTRFTNAGEVSTRGGELDLIWRPVRDLSVTGGLAYTDAHVDHFLAAPGAPASAIIPAGTPLAYAPKWKGSLSADYRWRTGGAVDFMFGGQGNFQSSEISTFSPNPVVLNLSTIHHYALINASAGIVDARDRYSVTFQVRNLFNESFAAAITNGGPGGAYRYQIPRDADRYFGVTARVNFGR